MPNHHRRTFLQSLPGLALSRLVATAQQPPQGHRVALRASQLGANTAITGMSLVDSVALLRRIGFSVIEIHAMGRPEATPGEFPGFRFDELDATQKESIRTALRGVKHVTAHLPYTGLDYFAKDDAVAAAALHTLEVALEGSAYFEAEVAVLHPKPGGGQTLDSQWQAMLRRIRRCGDLAQRHKMRIALETGFPQSIAGFVRLVEEVNHPAVGATIDVGHQGQYAELLARVKPEARATAAGIRAYNDTTLEIIERLGPKVFHLHIHDIDPATWKEHRPLGTGFVDYGRLFRLLSRLNFEGFMIFEIGGAPERMEQYLRDGKERLETMLT